MAYMVLVVNCPGLAIGDLNNKTHGNVNPEPSMNGAANIIDGIRSGAIRGTVQITNRDTDPSVATSGTGSTQKSYTIS